MATNKEIIKVEVKGAKKSKSALKGVGSMALKMGGAFFAARGIVTAVKASVKGFGAMEKSQKKLETVLKSTKGAAGLTAKELNNMGAALSDATTFGKSAIRNTQSLMLTFTKVGGDVMPQATEAILNMSAAMGSSLQQETIRLGKALQDPIMGVTALRRVGVQLSEEQTKSIKKFVEQGEVAKAQKVILGELETQFGGMAKAQKDTMEGSIATMKRSLSAVGVVIGEALAPAIKKGANIIEGIATAGKGAINFAKTIDWTATFTNIQENFGLITEAWGKTIRLMMDFLPDAMGGILPKMFEVFKTLLIAIKDAMVFVATDLWKPIGNALETLIFDLSASWEIFKTQTGDMMDMMGARTKNIFIGVARSVLGTVNDIAQGMNDVLGTSFDQIELPDLIDTEGMAEKQQTELDRMLQQVEFLRERMIEAQEGSEIVDFLSTMFMGGADTDDVDTLKELADGMVAIWTETGLQIIAVNDKIIDSNDDLDASNQNLKDGKKDSSNTFIKLTDAQKTSGMEAATQMVADFKVMADANEKFKKLYKASAIALTIASTYRSAQTQFQKFSESFPAPLGQILGGIAAAAAVGAGLARVQQIKKAQYGADFITSGPQMMMVGDNPGGEERVQITPIGTPNLEGPQGQGITLNISGNVLHESFIEDNVIPQIREGLRLGENMGI